MEFTFDNGAGAVQIVWSNASSILCDNQWHHISVRKSLVTGHLTVDGIDTVKDMSSVAGIVGVDSYAPLYFGGVPGKTFSSSFPHFYYFALFRRRRSETRRKASYWVPRVYEERRAWSSK